MSTAVVLSGGANLGAVHVGMLRALVEHGVTPDLIVGTSVGAVNGGYVASRWDRDGIDGLDALWTGLRRQDIFPTRLLGGFLGFIGRTDHMIPNDGLRGLVERQLDFARLGDSPIALHVVATNLLTGLDRRFSTGDAVDAILASAAIPAIFPPITIDGIPYIDGGVVNNTPISHAVELGASDVWVLPAGTACGLEAAPTSSLAMALQALSLLINRRLQRDITALADRCNLRVFPPLCPVTVSPTDFGKARELIDRSYRQSVEWITSDVDRPGAQDLSHVLEHPHARV